MARQSLWLDEYWLLLMQLYLRKPAGVKPLYSKPLVDLALELHIPPQYLYAKMFRLRQIDTPKLQRLWDTYSRSQKRLSRAVALLRRMKGFGNAGEFYDGVAAAESWELDFKAVDGAPEFTPIKLIMVLDLYFRLTPATMVEETPEVVQLAKAIKVSAADVCRAMDAFKHCDPYLNRPYMGSEELALACQEVWNRYGNDNPEKLAALAAQMKDYFK